MNNITFKRIKQTELPYNLIFQLQSQYETERSDFVVCMERRKRILYLNDSVPEKDIQGFVECINYPDYYVNDDAGMGKFLEHVFNTYGREVYRIVLDLHDWWRCEKRKEASKTKIRKLQPKIEELRLNKEIDETLLLAAHECGNAIKGKTAENLISHGDEYIFYLGYLTGNGVFRET